MIDKSHEEETHDDHELVVIADAEAGVAPEDNIEPKPEIPIPSDPRSESDALELKTEADEPVIRQPTVALSAPTGLTRQVQKISAVRIPDSKKVELSQFDIWEADRVLRSGASPQQVREEQADVLMIGKRNGFLLWIQIGLCVSLVFGTFLNVYLALNKPAMGIPSTEQVGIYTKAVRSKAEIEAFAERISCLMEMWKYETIAGHTRRVTPYLDPTQRAKWEADFASLTSDARAYKERSLYETVSLKYRGVANEISHQVLVYYQVYRGRGEQEGAIKFDATVRRVKLLVIQEGAINDENSYGLYITRLIDIPERAYMENEKFSGEANPWDVGLGIKPKKKKPGKADKEKEAAK